MISLLWVLIIKHLFLVDRSSDRDQLALDDVEGTQTSNLQAEG